MIPRSDIGTVNQELIDFLAESGLETSDVSAWRFISKFEVQRVLGAEPDNKSRFDNTTRLLSDAIYIPYHDLSGAPIKVNGQPFARVRLLSDKIIGKYRSPAGSGVRLYIPARLQSLMASAGPLVITEGEKKAEALCKIGVPCVGIGGVAMGCVRTNAEDKTLPRELLPALADIIKTYVESRKEADDARVVVLFDSDGFPNDHGNGNMTAVRINGKQKYVQNKGVYFEALRLSKAIREYFADSELPVGHGWCPFYNGEKQGVDDYIINYGQESVIANITSVATQANAESAIKSAEKSARKMNALREGYAPLGHAGNTTVIWSVPLGKVLQLTAQQLSRETDLKLAVGVDYALESWNKMTKDGDIVFDVKRAHDDIIRKCHGKPAWSDTRERGGGVWADRGGLVINADAGLFRATDAGLVVLSDEDRYSHEYIYTSTGRYCINNEESGVDPARLLDHLETHLQKWGWGNTTDPILLAGWILSQAYLGALDARPNITLCGESGAGKSVLAGHVSELLGGTAWKIDDGANSTAAGLRQKIGKDAVTLLIDESEPGSSDVTVAHQRQATVRRVLDLLRAAFSAGDGERTLAAVKGSQNGQAVEFSVRTSAMILAISRPDMEQADRNRFIVLEVDKKRRAEQAPSTQGLQELGDAIRLVMWARWDTFTAIYARLMAEGGAVAQGADARLLKTWGVPLSAYATLKHGANALTDEAFADVLAQFGEIVKHQGDAGGVSAVETDADRALRMLLSAPMVVEITDPSPNGPHTRRVSLVVGEVVEGARKSDPTAHDNAYACALKRHGMARSVDDPSGATRLFVSDCASLRDLLRGTPYSGGQSILNVLSRLPGAQRERVRVASGRVSGVVVPIPQD